MQIRRHLTQRGLPNLTLSVKIHTRMLTGGQDIMTPRHEAGTVEPNASVLT
jgi:hypothetical protein